MDVYHPVASGPPAIRVRRPAVLRSQAVFSLVGVLAITLVLFVVVALTARLILGR